MKTLELLERPTAPSEVGIGSNESSSALNVAGVYQDGATREWAVQSYRRATRVAGESSVQDFWYDIDSLSDPGILLEAVHATLLADVIVVSVHAADELPLNLYVWVTAWLPRRLMRAGALAALVGVAEPLDSPSVRTIAYLQAVARKARLDFAPQARQRLGASPVAPKPTAQPAGPDAPVREELPSQRYFPYYHWGLNE